MLIDLYWIFISFFLVLNLISPTHLFKIETENIIQIVNSKSNHSWRAGLNFNSRYLKDLPRLTGVLPLNQLTSEDTLLTSDLPINKIRLPQSYDVRKIWSKCKSIVSIRDQSNCGSCWALSTASVFSDRFCIASNTTVNKVFSGEYINSCCTSIYVDGCKGGYPEKAWKFIKNNGICTGGEYGSNEGCQPYSLIPCPRMEVNSCLKENEDTPPCYHQCTNPNYLIPLKSDLYYASKVYSVKSNMEAIMNDIFTNGPVVAAMKVYKDFLYYKRGIYQYTAGKFQGDHAVKLLGWGQDDGIDYWLCANTWGTYWGDGGFFKIRRGINECGIESRITGGLPKIK